MKKRYFSIAFLLVGSICFGQVVIPEIQISEDQFNEQTAYYIPTTTPGSNSAVPIWEEDFGGGFPAGWSSYTANTAGGASMCPWVWSTDGSWGYWQGSSGTSAGTALTSTTASNGFLISDSDSANHHTYGQPSGTTYQYIDSYFTTDAIDLANYPAVTLEFEQYLRFNNLGNGSFIAPKVSVSSDSVTWTDFDVYGTASNNSATVNGDIVSLNISAVAGTQPTVYLRFGWTSRCYFWMLDDLRIIETVPNKLKFTSETFGGWWIGYQATGDYGIDFTFNPMSQVTASPYRFEGVIENQGSAPQSATQLNVEVIEAGSSIFTANSSPSTLNVALRDTVATTTNFTPVNMGYHLFNFWASSVNVLTDTIGRGAVVTDTVYGVDYDWNTDGSNTGSGYFLGRSCGGQVLGNAFDIYADATITSISFHVTDNSVPGAVLKVEVYETDPSASVSTTPPIWYAESEDYTLTTADTNSWVTLSLKNPLQVNANTTWLAAVHGEQGFSGDTSLISSTSNPNTASYLQDNCDAAGPWYSTSKALFIRMNLTSGVTAVESHKIEGKIAVSPNPSNGKFVVDLPKLNNTDYNIQITNILGKIVFSKDLTVQERFSEEIDVSDLAKGVYLLELSDNKTVITEKIVIE